jgi:hypothetical protein
MQPKNSTVFATDNVPFYDQNTLTNWCDKGFSDEQEAVRWHKKACGVACTRMVVDALKGEKTVFGSLIKEAAEAGAYQVGVGWVHYPLALFIAKRFKLFATAHRQVSIDRMKAVLIEGSLIIASVGLNFSGRKSGHLIVVLGCETNAGEVSGFYVHHPSSDPECCLIEHFIPLSIFEESFSKNIIEIKNNP